MSGAPLTVEMPVGYELWMDEEVHFWWFHPATRQQSEMHSDRWEIYRSAKLHRDVFANEANNEHDQS